MARSESFHESIRLVLQLHRLMAAGKGETPEANLVRAASERPWYAMSEEEQELVNGLSEDLYDVSPGASGPAQTSLSSAAFGQLLLANRWAEALNYLRSNKSEITSSELALHRGGIWAHLMEDDVAFEFYRFAFDKSRELPESAVILYLQSAISIGAFDAVGALARSLLQPGVAPVKKLMAAQWQFAKMMVENEAIDDNLLKNTLTHIEDALASLDPGDNSDYLRLMVRNANLTAACCYANFGEWDRASGALDEILRHFPDDEVAGVFRRLIADSRNANGEVRDHHVLSRSTIRDFARNRIIPVMSPRMALAA